MARVRGQPKTDVHGAEQGGEHAHHSPRRYLMSISQNAWGVAVMAAGLVFLALDFALVWQCCTATAQK